MKSKLVHLPLEPLQARYTELLNSWENTAFSENYDVIPIVPAGEPITVISNGSVLDSVNRPIWAMEQTVALLKSQVAGQVYFSDFFHPGLEALPYTGRDYRAYSFCWAQSFDRFDFTRKMIGWMRPYEAMGFGIYRKVFVASRLLQDLIITTFPGLTEEEVVFVGLPFNSEDVAARFDTSFQPGPYDVVYSSRFDTEKDPALFLDLVEMMPSHSFAICTGHPDLKGNDYAQVARAKMLADRGKLTIHADLTKAEYYSVLKASKVQFNSSKQDWVSFTLLEAITHGCIPIYPNFRDFSGVFAEVPGLLYIPGNRKDASAQVLDAIEHGINPSVRSGLRRIVEFHDGTLNRISDTMHSDR